MVAFLYRMPAGIPGDVNRAQQATVEARVITPSGNANAPTAYGIPVALDATSQQIRAVIAADVTANIYGILVRPFPTNSTQNPIGVSTPPAAGPCDVLRRGYVEVKLSGSAAAIQGGAVNVWTAAPTGNHITGGFEAAVTAGSTIAINATFMGPADAGGQTEIAYNI